MIDRRSIVEDPLGYTAPPGLLRENLMTDDAKSGTPDERLMLNRLLVGGGLLGAVSALIGAFIAGAFSIASANAESERSRQEFFLTERVEVNASLMSEGSGVQITAARLNASVQSGTESDAAERAALRAEAVSQYEGVVASSWQIQVIGTPPVQEVKEDIAKSTDDAWRLMGENTDEAARFFEMLDDESRALSVRFSGAVADGLGVDR
jgi:hypothetical protein